MKETNARSIVKTVSWRVVAGIASFLISWYVTGSIELAGILLASKAGLNTILYFVHERLWSKVSWGFKQKENDHDRPDDNRVSYSGHKASS